MAALVDVTWAEVQTLQRAGDAVDHDIQSKFAGSIEAAYSGLSTFFGGLEGVIGGPSPKVHEAMATEHTQGSEADELFTTGNYGLQTCAKIEWLFVADEDATPEQLGLPSWPAESEGKLPDRGRCRKRRPLADICLLYTSPSPRDRQKSRMPSSA